MKMDRTIFSAIALLMLCTTSPASTPPGFGSGRLTRSVQNETFAAIDRAIDWLISRQSTDGSWGGDIELTAVCALAVSGGTTNIPAGNLRAALNAVLWLHSPETTIAIDKIPDKTRLGALAWRDIAGGLLAGHPPSDAIRSGYAATNMTASEAIAVHWPLCEARLLRGMAIRAPMATPAQTSEDIVMRLVSEAESSLPSKDRTEILRAAATAYANGELNEILAAPQMAWWFARAVNRSAAGDLYLSDTNNTVRNLAWRRDLAGKWTTSQKTDSFGNGSWENDAKTTAYVILLLNEL